MRRYWHGSRSQRPRGHAILELLRSNMIAKTKKCAKPFLSVHIRIRSNLLSKKIVENLITYCPFNSWHWPCRGSGFQPPRGQRSTRPQCRGWGWADRWGSPAPPGQPPPYPTRPGRKTRPWTHKRWGTLLTGLPDSLPGISPKFGSNIYPYRVNTSFLHFLFVS